jgi:uncharacterized protein (TIGR02391 family)
VEVRVRELSGVEAVGQALMAEAFGGNTPRIGLLASSPVSARDEQEGFRFLFMGAMRGIRNPKAHDFVEQDDPNRTLEYLAFASLLMHRLDDTMRARPNAES